MTFFAKKKLLKLVNIESLEVSRCIQTIYMRRMPNRDSPHIGLLDVLKSRCSL